jgi:hypothetical protein
MQQKQQDDINSAAARMYQQETQNIINNTMNNRPVYCNTVGGVTMCN